MDHLSSELLDVNIRLNFSLVADGPHPAVDYKAVWRKIDQLLDEKSRRAKGTNP